ncbi:NAD(P)H-dependent oxidoreductase [Candidatus Bipolaricaulota bacterium]|nr:NAD(P)H-dependent oxidoreductase [Candidatus Bipolaricaulota bacterium]
MASILLIYHSGTGNTKAMAEAVAKGVRSVGVEVDLKPLEQASVDDLPNYDGIVIGTPTYFASMTAEVKRFIDDSIKYYTKLQGKVGAAFASSGDLGGGAETAVMDILRAFLVHGMIVPGFETGGHYGPVSVGAPDEGRKEVCERMGAQVAKLVVRLSD